MGDMKRQFEGKPAGTLSGPLLGALRPLRPANFARNPKQQLAGAAPQPVGNDRFAGAGGTLGQPAVVRPTLRPAAEPQPAAQPQPAAEPVMLGAQHQKQVEVVLRAVRSDGREVEARFKAVLPADANITALDAYEK